jgi:hypothetical protein
VSSHLPVDTKLVSAEKRAAYLKGRHLAYLQLHGE